MTETTTVPPRSEIAREHTWNAESVFESIEAWEAEYKRLVGETLPGIAKLQERISEGPAGLADVFETLEVLMLHIGKVYVYAGMSYRVDTTNSAAAAMGSQALGLFGQAFAAVAFLNPALLAIGEETLRQWIADEPRLTIYTHYIDDLFRKQAHVRSVDVEEVLGILQDPIRSVETTSDMLTDADFKFPPAVTSDGREIEVTQGSIENILNSPDREARRTAWEGYADTYLAFKNTLANNLIVSVKLNVLEMRARRYASTLEAKLFEDNIPTEVFHSLIGTFKKNLPTWHRYWAIRRKALGVDTLHPYDVWAPLTTKRPTLTYEEAVDWVCKGLAPMGEEYVGTVRRGCLKERWIDIYPNQGKASGAYSWGFKGTYPFILMSFNNDVPSLGTLTHELGHSMHSYLAWQTQPMIYCQYSLFVAEVASNFHQALVRAYLLEHSDEPALQISVIEDAMDNFHRYFFIMPTLARFELEVHERVERGEGLSADDMINLLADLFGEGFGDGMHLDRQRVGITWAQFSHLYVDYYVYQYATGIAGAHALASRVLSGEASALDDYLNFLKAGNSMYAMDALKMAGVDLTTPEPVEAAFEVLADYVDRLEELLG